MLKKQLKKHNFKKKWLSDRSGFWHEKRYTKNKITIKIIVDDMGGKWFVFLEISNEKSKTDVEIKLKKATKKNLKKILNKFEQIKKIIK